MDPSIRIIGAATRGLPTASGPTGGAWASAFLSALTIPVGSKDGITIHNLSGKWTDGHRRKDELATGADTQGEKSVQRPNGGLTLRKRRNGETVPEGGTPRWRKLQTASRGQSCRDQFKHMQQGLTSEQWLPSMVPRPMDTWGAPNPWGRGTAILSSDSGGRFVKPGMGVGGVTSQMTEAQKLQTTQFNVIRESSRKTVDGPGAEARESS